VCSLFGTNLILIALVNFEYTFVLNPTATDGCVSSRIYLNSTYAPTSSSCDHRRNSCKSSKNSQHPVIGDCVLERYSNIVPFASRYSCSFKKDDGAPVWSLFLVS
jgi:hypothetical protein